jgi:PAS domain S-box-containing protein
VVDTEGWIGEMNATQLGWLGYTRAEVVGRMRLTDLIKPGECRQVMQLLTCCKSKDRLSGMEHTLVAKDACSLPVRLDLRAMHDQKG